jgi:hypothetical protein
MSRRLPIGVLALVLLGAGCGGGATSNGEAKKPAEQVVTDAQKAALDASAVHVSGSVVSSGQPLTLDLQLTKGKGGKGTITEGKLSFELVRVGSKAYIRGSDAFLRQVAGTAAAQLLHGRWLEGPATTGELASLAPLTDLEKLFAAALGSHGKLKNEGQTTYKGQKAVAIEDTTQGGTLYVAATGTPYPIAIEGGHHKGAISFTDWNKSVAISAPKGAVDLSKLGG